MDVTELTQHIRRDARSRLLVEIDACELEVVKSNEAIRKLRARREVMFNAEHDLTVIEGKMLLADGLDHEVLTRRHAHILAQAYDE